MEKTKLTHLPRAATPESVGVSSRVVKEFMHDCDRMGLNLHSVMFVRHGVVAAECAWAPYRLDVPHSMFSFSKQVTAIAIGFAVCEGLLSLDDKVCKYFPYTSGDKKLDEMNAKVTIYDLITQRSGKNISIFTTNNEKHEWLQNWLDSPFNSEPGTKWNYLSENIYMLSRLISKVSGVSMTEFLTPRLFEPLGIEKPYWEHDHNGYDAGGWGAFLKTEDMAKIGLCFLNMGKYDGKQVIPEEWIKLSTQRHLDAVSPVFSTTQGYGFQLFIQPPERGTYSFNGLYTQFAVIYPEHDAVFACNGGELREGDFLALIYKHTPAAFIDNTDEDPEGFAELQAYEKKISNRMPPMARRYPDSEAKINGREIKTTGRFNASLLGSGNSFYLSGRAGQMNSIRFHFSEDSLKVEWQEKNSPKAEIEVGLDGEFKFSEIQLSELAVPVASYGTWTEANVFKLTVVPLSLAQYRELTFRFLPGGFVHVTSVAKPGFPELFEFYIQFNGIHTNLPLHYLCKAFGAAAGGFVLDPNFFGKVM